MADERGGDDVDATAAERREILARVRTVAVVGASANPTRPSHDVAAALVALGLTVYPVNPREETILGLTCYPSLAALPIVPDIVDVFRAAPALPGVVEEAIALGAPVVWFQLGLRNDVAARAARTAGVQVVQDRCLKVDYAAFRRSAA